MLCDGGGLVDCPEALDSVGIWVEERRRTLGFTFLDPLHGTAAQATGQVFALQAFWLVARETELLRPALEGV